MAPKGKNNVSKGTKNVAEGTKNVAKGTKNVTKGTLWPCLPFSMVLYGLIWLFYGFQLPFLSKY